MWLLYKNIAGKMLIFLKVNVHCLYLAVPSHIRESKLIVLMGLLIKYGFNTMKPVVAYYNQENIYVNLVSSITPKPIVHFLKVL